MSVEIIEVFEILGVIEIVSVNTAPCHHHISDTADKSISQHRPYIILVKIFKETAVFNLIQAVEIIKDIIVNHILCSIIND
ncbi:MAG: hypothetical protein IKI97_00600 [Clostridia bacterium]|nr:hypothetical protein [Clostridia bacterium]